MSGPESIEPDDLPAVLESRTRKTLSDVRLVLILAAFFAVTLPGGGWIALAQVREQAREEVKPTILRVEALEARQATTDASVVEANRRAAAVERTVMVIDLNMRLMLESQKIKPIEIPNAPADSGGR